jgi:hypothetical protein
MERPRNSEGRYLADWVVRGRKITLLDPAITRPAAERRPSGGSGVRRLFRVFAATPRRRPVG